MRKRFLLDGEYEGKPVWIAVAFKEEEISVWLHVFDKKKLIKEHAQQWVRGEYELPESLLTLERTINDDNLLTEELLVANVGKVRDIEIEWADNVMLTRMMQGFHGDLTLLKERVAILNDYDQQVFDECTDFWNRVLSFKQEHAHVTQAHIDRFKLDVDVLFEALKSLRKDYRKELKGKAEEAKQDLHLKLDILSEKFDKQANYKFTSDRLKDIRQALNASGLRQKDYADIDTRINELFTKMSEARKAQSGAKVDKRIADLEAIIEKMTKSIDWEKRNMEKEERNKERSGQIFQVKLIDAKLAIIKSKIADKEQKLADVQKTLASLQKRSG